MATQTALDLSVLEEAQDLVVIRPSGKDSYVYAVKPSLAFQKTTYDESVSDHNDFNVPAFNSHWKFDDKVGIKGLSTFLGLRLDKKALRPRGLWIPGLLEAKALENAGKLETGVYRNYGLTVYSDENPNKEVAQALTRQAGQLGLSLPLINPFKALDYDINPKASSGIDLRFVQSPEGIISGEEAKRLIDSLNYRGNSGAQELYRGRGGSWNADWDDLGDSDEYGRVDWVCGEATAQILKEAYNALLERRYGERISKLREEEQRLRAEQEADIFRFEESLSNYLFLEHSNY